MTVEKLGDDCLDVGTLLRAGILGDNWRTWRSLSLCWPDIVKIRANRYLVELELVPRKRTVPQQIRVSWTRCHLGCGMRPWLHCPFCERRVAKLLNGLSGYYCRACVGHPPYASQTKSTQSRRHFAACKLRLSLGGTASLTSPFPDRPPGMHWKTYARLRRKAERLETGLSARIRKKTPDYPSLVYHLPKERSRERT